MQSNRERPPLLVRADADATQGTGHVMRCLALAHEWRSGGGSIGFVTARPAPQLSRRIQMSGAIVSEIAEAHPNVSDLDATIRILEQVQQRVKSPPWVVLDGYHFDHGYQNRLRRAGCQLLVIDDDAHLPRYDADIVINHGIRAPRLDYRANDDAWLLLGTRYALLRKEFVERRDFKRDVGRKAKNILVTLGGGDAGNVTDKVVGALQQLGDLDLEIQVLVGALNPHLAELRRISRASHNIRLQSGVTDLAPLMAWADVAVAAGGTTAWELAFMQVPSVLLAIAENQAPVAEGIDEFGAASSLGRAHRISAGEIAGALRELIGDPERRRRMALRGRILVDGMGVQRIVAAMEEREPFFSGDDFWLRQAGEDDRLLLWQWANDPGVRRNSFSMQAISWEDHESWCEKKLSSPDCRIWIMQIGALPVGQVRYDRIVADTAEVSLSIAPGFRGKQLGTRLLEASAPRAARELKVGWLQGVVRIDNVASRRAFLKAGFEGSKHHRANGDHCWVFRRPAHVSSRREDHVAVH